METSLAQPKEFYELLDNIERRPGMYLGDERLRLSSLEAFLHGYEQACRIHGLPSLHIGQQFARWLKDAKRMKLGGVANGAFGLAEINAANESEAWSSFFAWFREYHTLITGHSFSGRSISALAQDAR